MMDTQDLFKPFFAYKKYWIAHKVLKMIGKPTIWHSEPRKKNETPVPIFKVTFSRFTVIEIMKAFPKVDPLKIMTVISLLAENDHIETIKNEDMNKYGVFCTKNGQIALQDSYYIKKVYLFVVGIIGIPGGIAGIIGLLQAIL